MHDDTCCKGFEERIILSYYGEIGPDESKALETHLLSCPACRAYREGLARTLEAVPAYVPRPYETRQAVEGVLAGITPSAVIGGRMRRLIPAFVATGLLAAGVLLTVYNPFSFVQKPPVDQVLMAKADWDAIEHIDVINDLDVVEAMDNDDDDGIEQL